MGPPVTIDENQRKINNLIDNLIEALEWYRKYTVEFELPDDVRNFTSRNINLLQDIEILSKSFTNFKKATISGDFSFTDEEMRMKAVQASVMMRYIFT
jgi:hypothetical protein